MIREECLKRKIHLKKQFIGIINDEIKLLQTELKQCQGTKKNAADPRPSMFDLPVVGGEIFPVYGEDVNEWSEAFPGVDVTSELKSMIQWCKSNPKKQKTRRGARKFITGWLSRAQDKPKPNIPPNQPIDSRPKLFPVQGAR